MAWGTADNYSLPVPVIKGPNGSAEDVQPSYSSDPHPCPGISVGRTNFPGTSLAGIPGGDLTGCSEFARGSGAPWWPWVVEGWGAASWAALGPPVELVAHQEPLRRVAPARRN